MKKNFFWYDKNNLKTLCILNIIFSIFTYLSIVYVCKIIFRHNNLDDFAMKNIYLIGMILALILIPISFVVSAVMSDELINPCAIKFKPLSQIVVYIKALTIVIVLVLISTETENIDKNHLLLLTLIIYIIDFFINISMWSKSNNLSRVEFELITQAAFDNIKEVKNITPYKIAIKKIKAFLILTVVLCICFQRIFLQNNINFAAYTISYLLMAIYFSKDMYYLLYEKKQATIKIIIRSLLIVLAIAFTYLVHNEKIKFDFIFLNNFQLIIILALSAIPLIRAVTIKTYYIIEKYKISHNKD